MSSYSSSLSVGLEMESAIKTVVMQFLSSARGKDNLGAKSFQKLVQTQLGGIMSVRIPQPLEIHLSVDPTVIHLVNVVKAFGHQLLYETDPNPKHLDYRD